MAAETDLDDVQKLVADALAPIFQQVAPKDRAEIAHSVLCLGYEVTRGIHGNEFMRGWLNAALIDLDTNPQMLVIKSPEQHN